MSTPNDSPEMRRSFLGESPHAAREAASKWLGDFSGHGPLDIRSINVSGEGNAFAATVVYSEASIEITLRHFPDLNPAVQSAA